MSTKKWDERITTRYAEPDRNIYEQVIALVKQNNIPKSNAQLLLVKRGLQHTNNPEPLIKEKVVYRDKPVIQEKIVYRDKPSIPKVDEGIQTEHVAMDDHITDRHIRGDTEFEQRPSGDIRTTQDKAVSPHNTALDVKKSPKADSDGQNGGTGWKIAGGLGIVGIIALVGYKIWTVYH